MIHLHPPPLHGPKVRAQQDSDVSPAQFCFRCTHPIVRLCLYEGMIRFCDPAAKSSHWIEVKEDDARSPMQTFAAGPLDVLHLRTAVDVLPQIERLTASDAGARSERSIVCCGWRDGPLEAWPQAPGERGTIAGA